MNEASSNPVRVRFAPSPTGFLHIGGARTALFNFLFARGRGGLFLLRIEDTDVSRSSPEMTENILDSLRWLGLSWDGEPVFQSSRRGRHAELCRALLDSGAAYPCFCDPEDLKRKREAAPSGGAEYKYDRACRGVPKAEAAARMSAGEPHAVRFRVPDGRTLFSDLIRGEVTVAHTEIDDFILLRSDGTPVYQAAVVADDRDMGITHVIRGDDHLSNTPKQVLLYRAMGWPVPEFAHVPMILGPDKKRLSKRHGATSVEEYRRQGILPETLRNFLALLGWNPGDDREILPLEELTGLFSLDAVSKKSAVFDEQKLAWMNAQYLGRLPEEDLADRVARLLPAGLAPPPDEAGRALLMGFVRLMLPRVQKLTEFAEKGGYFFADPAAYEPAAAGKHWADRPASAGALEALRSALSGVPAWKAADLDASVRGLADTMQVKAGTLIQSARLALTGATASPGLFELMEVLGREAVLRRMDKAVGFLKGREMGFGP